MTFYHEKVKGQLYSGIPMFCENTFQAIIQCRNAGAEEEMWPYFLLAEGITLVLYLWNISPPVPVLAPHFYYVSFSPLCLSPFNSLTRPCILCYLSKGDGDGERTYYVQRFRRSLRRAFYHADVNHVRAYVKGCVFNSNIMAQRQSYISFKPIGIFFVLFSKVTVGSILTFW